jgi:hypothetical protein
MAAHDPGPPTGDTRSHLFTVRVWPEAVAGGLEFRGSARHLASGSVARFRTWSGLGDFVGSCIQEDDARHGRLREETS